MVSAAGTKRPLKERLRGLAVDVGVQFANYFVILFLSLAIGAVIILLSGKNPLAAYASLFKGALGNPLKAADTLDRASVLILTGLAAVIAFRTSVWNLGLEGQLYVGAFAAAWVGFSIQGLPAIFHIPLALLAGALAGGLWSLPVILLKLRWKVNELVSTLMLNYIGILFTAYLVAFPFYEPTAQMPGTSVLYPTARLPRLIPGSVLNLGFPLALVFAVLIFVLLYRTKTGYEMRMTGLNSQFAEYVGMPTQRSALLAMVLSGALAGLGGAIVITGFFGRFISSFSTGYGWDGMVISLLAQNHPLGVIPASIFYAALANGALTMQSATGVPQAIVDTVKGTIMFFVTAQVFLTYLNRRVRK